MMISAQKFTLTEDEALGLNILRSDAAVDGDMDVLQEVLSEKFMQVHGGGTVQRKSDYVESRRFRPGRIEFKSRKAYDTEVVLSDGCFLVRENVDIIEYFPENSGFSIVGDHATRIRICNVWHRESDGTWRCLHTAVSNRTSARAQ